MTASRIRVMFLVPDLIIGGAERHLTTLAPRMNRETFQASVICIGQEGVLFDALRHGDVAAEALNLSGKKNAIRALLQLVSRMRTDQPDVVVMRGYSAEVLGRIAARVAGVKHTIVWVHGFDFEHERRSSLRNVLNRIFIRGTSSYFGVAEAQRPYLIDGLRCPADKVRIIHNGVEMTRFDGADDRQVLAEFDIADDAPVVGIVAAMRPEKDHATLLEAARIALNDIPDLHILIVGEGATRRDMEELAHRLGISDRVHFAGARSDIPQLLRAIDVFVLCSTKETFPVAILEAMASARPVVCTDVGGVSEVVEHGVSGYLVPPRHPNELASRLTELLSSPVSARRMGLAGQRRIAEDYSLDRSVAITESAIREIVCG